MSINLLPPDYLRKKSLRKQLKTIAATQAVVFFVFVLLVCCIKLTSRALDRQSALCNEKLEDPSYIDSDGVALTLRSKKAQFESLNSSIQTLVYDEGISSSLLLALTNSLPPQMHIRSLQIKDGNITLRAASPIKRLVSDYMTALEPYFSQIRLTSISAEENGFFVDLNLVR